MKYVITGANGQLGRALQKEIQKTGQELFCYDREGMDITRYAQVESILEQIRPDCVFNCAAYTNVDRCEQDKETAYKVNAMGSQNLAMACQKGGIKLLHVSTDYVFSGEEDRPRIESDPTLPQTVYGKSKKYGEDMVFRYCPTSFVIRTAWLYGEGKNFVRTMLELSTEQKHLRVVGDQFGTPTYAKDLAKSMLQLSQTQYYGLYHGTCQGFCSWYDFAKTIFDYCQIEVDIEKVSSEEFVRPAKRPKFSVLDNFMLRLRGIDTFRDWKEALQDYLSEEENGKNTM